MSIKNTKTSNQLIMIGGKACSGKSTIGRALANRLDVPFLSMGNFSREYAKNTHGMEIQEFQDFCLTNPKVDCELDALFCAQCREVAALKGAVIDFRLGGHFFPESYRIFLQVSDTVAAERGKQRGDETLESIQKRNEAMRTRLSDAYGYDFTNMDNYSRTISVDHYSELEITNMILGMLPAPWFSPNSSRTIIEGIYGVDFGNGPGKPY